MNTLRDRDVSDYRQQRSDYRDQSRDQDREISLGTGTILGIFFMLALLCTVFFGFGYSMGRKSSQLTAVAGTSAPAGLFSGLKPSPGSPSGPASLVRPANPANTAASDHYAEPAPAAPTFAEHASIPKQPAVVVRTPETASTASSTLAQDVPVSSARPAPRPASAAITASSPAPLPMPAVTPNGTVMVQIAAVSHQEDADLLLAALKKRSYAVFIRPEPQDHLLHVQVGPFANRKDADAMRQRLLADGYNAIVK